MIQLSYNLDTRKWSGPNNRAISSISVKLRDRVSIAIAFIKGGTQINLTNATGKLGLKKKGVFFGEYIAVAPSWTPSGNPATYTFDLNLNTDAAGALFAGGKVNATSANLTAEVSIEQPNTTTSTALLDVVLENDLIQGNEGTPEVIPSLKATKEDAEAGTNNEKWTTPLRVAEFFEVWKDKLMPAGFYATLVNGVVPASQLPSFVDDVLEFQGLGSFPMPGETGKIYISISTKKTYRWSGSTYIEIASSPGSTDGIPEGANNLYFTAARASAAAPVQSVNGRTGAVIVTKNDVGLGNVDNTSDANKPISAAVQNALNTKQAVGSYATLVDGRVPIEQLTSYLQLNDDGDLEPSL
jgi:hypothetical protein